MLIGLWPISRRPAVLFPGDTPDPVPGLCTHWRQPISRRPAVLSRGDDPPDPPRGPFTVAGWGLLASFRRAARPRYLPGEGPRPPGPSASIPALAGGVRGRGRVGGARMGPCLAPWPSGLERQDQSRRPVPGWSVRRLVRGRTGGRGSSGDGCAFRRRRRPARGDDEGGGLTAGRPVYLLVTSAAGNGRARHP